MRLGARTTLLPCLGLILTGLAVFAQAPVDGDYVTYVLPAMILLGTGAGLGFPGADDARHVRRHAAGRGARVRARQHHGAGRRRAGSRGARDPVHVAERQPDQGGPLDRGSADRRYHFAFWVGAALVGAAIVAALTVLRPEPKPDELAAAEPFSRKRRKNRKGGFKPPFRSVRPRARGAAPPRPRGPSAVRSSRGFRGALQSQS
jgi:hypothetical protein